MRCVLWITRHTKNSKRYLIDIGYTDEAKGMDNNSVEIKEIIHEQSPEIAQGVDADNF